LQLFLQKCLTFYSKAEFLLMSSCFHNTLLANNMASKCKIRLNYCYNVKNYNKCQAKLAYVSNKIQFKAIAMRNTDLSPIPSTGTLYLQSLIVMTAQPEAAQRRKSNWEDNLGVVAHVKI